MRRKLFYVFAILGLLGAGAAMPTLFKDKDKENGIEHRMQVCRASVIYLSFFYELEKKTGSAAMPNDIQEFVLDDALKPAPSLVTPANSSNPYFFRYEEAQKIALNVIMLRHSLALLLGSEKPDPFQVVRYSFTSCLSTLHQVEKVMKDKGLGQ